MAPRSIKRKITGKITESAILLVVNEDQTTDSLALPDAEPDVSAKQVSSTDDADETTTKKLKLSLSADESPNSAPLANPANNSLAASIVSVGEDLSANITTDAGVAAGSMLKIINYNVAGIRAAFNKGLSKFVEAQQPDIMCFTEVKALKEENPFKPAGYHIYWNASFAKKGYSGVGLYSKTVPLKVEYGIGHSLDDEGRCIIAEYPEFKLALCYTPNAGEDLKTLPKRMQWDNQFLESLKKHAGSGKPLLITGDLNCAHLDFDVYDGETNKKRAKGACFTPEERANFGTMLADLGLVDLYRKLYPDEREKHYTYFSFRHGAKAKNAGWRLDYFLASPALAEKVIDVRTCKEENCSDHVPLVLTLKK